MLPVRVLGPYHSELLDELLCGMNSPRRPEEMAGAVILLSYEGYHKTLVRKASTRTRCMHGRGRALKSEGALDQTETQVRIFHIKKNPGQFLQDQTTS